MRGIGKGVEECGSEARGSHNRESGMYIVYGIISFCSIASRKCVCEF